MSDVTTVTLDSSAATTGAAAPATTVERPEYIPEKFWKGSVEESTKEMAKSYAELEKKQGTAEPAPATPAVESPAAPTAESKAIEAKLTAAAGSEAALKATLDWARSNATPDQKALFDAALESANPALVEMAYAAIKQSHIEAVGAEGVRVTGAGVPTTSGAKPFISQDEIARFVNTPAYKAGDRAVHAEYEARMKVTNW
jgi:hypothetical protein